MKRENLTASRLAFIVVLAMASGIFVWWYRNRPSYLLYQAHRAFDSGNQSAVVSEYKRLLSDKNLKPEDEIRLRMALAEFYIRALQETSGFSTLSGPSYEVENPFANDAKKELERVLQLDGSHAAAHYYMGRILWARRLESFAIEELNKSRSLDPQNPEPLWFLARVYLERGNASQARELSLQALAIRPDFDQARLALVDAYADLGDHENALKEFDRLSFSFRNDPDIEAQQALYLSKQNEWDRCLDLIESAIKESPNNGRIKIIYGRILLDLGRFEEAAGQFGQSAALLQRNVWPGLWQVNAFWRRGDCEEATRVSQLLVQALPRWGWSHLAHAWALLCRGETPSALLELEEAERLAPDLMEAKELRAQILLEMGRFAELGKMLRPLLDQKKDESMAYEYLAGSLLLQGKASMAIEMAESAIKSNHQNAQALVWLGRARAQSGDSAGSLRAFENARSLRNFDPVIQAWLSNGSITELKQLAQSNSRIGSLWLMLAQAYAQDKKWPEAVDAYQNALAIQPWLLQAQSGLHNAIAWRDKTRK